MHTVQSDSNNINLFSFHCFFNVLQKCRTIELSDYHKQLYGQYYVEF